MRIGGIASGIDTETIIRDLMKVERMPLDRFFQRKQTIEWQRDANREMNLLFKNLDDVASNIRLRSSLNTRQASSSDESILTATANASVKNGTYEVGVTQVAKAERYMSAEEISVDSENKISTSKSLESQTDLFKDSNFGTEFSITTYKKDADGNVVSQANTFTVDGTKSLDDIFKEINGADLGVKAYYDTVFDRVVMEKTNTGIINEVGNEIEFTGEFFTALKIDNPPLQAAQDAEFTFTNNELGLSETIISKTNRNTVGGITVDLLKVGISNITVTSNTDDAFDKIKEFVDKYNETIEIVRSKLTEEKYRDFPPLTDEQRSELSEKEAEKWDEKAKSGLLRRDQTLESALNKMRSDLYSPVATGGQYEQITEIGITTSKNYLDGGKLEIDEEKLRAALADDPDSVHKLLNNVADKELTDIPKAERTAVENETIYNQTGLVGRLRASIGDSIDKIIDRAGNEFRTTQQYTLGRELINVDKQITSFQRRLTNIENRYWSQFTAMEQAMQRANAQGEAFMQQIGGGNF